MFYEMILGKFVIIIKKHNILIHFITYLHKYNLNKLLSWCLLNNFSLKDTILKLLIESLYAI